MNAKEIMTAPVITITPETFVHEIAELLTQRRIGGLPVVAHGDVVGIVNEGDLLHRHEIGTAANEGRRSWWTRLMESDEIPVHYVKTHGAKAKDVMSRHVVPVTEDTPVPQLASIFVARHVRRLPVMRGKVLVGIVTRADLIRALATKTREPETPRSQSDEAIRVRLLGELEQQRWWRPDWSAVYVRDGVVHFHGLIHTDGERQAARVAAENVPGVRGVEDERVTGVHWQPLV
jgi:CBS domain-containing protein